MAAEELGAGNYWQQLAVDALIDEIFIHQLNIASQVLDTARPQVSSAQAVEDWIAGNAETVSRAEIILNELWANDMDDLAMIAVASRQLRALCSS